MRYNMVSSSPRQPPPCNCNCNYSVLPSSSIKSLSPRRSPLSYHLLCIIWLAFCCLKRPLGVEAHRVFHDKIDGSKEHKNHRVYLPNEVVANNHRRDNDDGNNKKNQEESNKDRGGKNNNHSRNNNGGGIRKNQVRNNFNNNSNGISGTRRTSNKNNNEPVPSPAQRQLQAFFDSLRKLQHQHGSNVITVQDATEAYPILGQSHINMEDCPFDYLPWQDDDSLENNKSPPPQQQQQQQGGVGNNRQKKLCYTPIVTIHDRIANSWDQSINAQLPEVLLLSGLDDSPSEMDVLGPSSILETLRLLLECARCEALSPWVPIVEDNDGDDDDDNNESAKTDDDDELFGNNDDDNINEDGSNDTTSNSTAKTQHASTLTNAIQCRQDLVSQGIDDEVRKWLARLVATRRIVAVPIADVAGFYDRLVQIIEKNKGDDRHTATTNEDQQQKKNAAECDFPFPFHYRKSSSAGNNNGQSSPSATCMTTFPARLMNELFRSHAFQSGVSFHGANDDSIYQTMRMIEVPTWDRPAGKGKIVFDEKAMLELAWAYNQFGDVGPSSVRTIRASSVEQRQPDVYHGAMFEHFAFSAGMVNGGGGVNNEGSLWLEQCQGNLESDHDSDDTSSYPSEQTGLYDGSSLRAFVARVVAPRSDPLPLIENLPGFNPSYDPSDFRLFPHVALNDPNPIGFNVRTSLLNTELVEPWTEIRSIAGVDLRDDGIVPLSPHVPGECMHTRVMEMPESPLMGNTNVTWTVGGALDVAETAIMYGKWDVLDKKIFDCVTQPTKQELDAFFTILRDFEVMEGETAEEMAEDVNFTPVQSGVTRWHSSRSGATWPIIESMSPETTFSVSLDLSHYKVGDVIAIYSLARTDQGWVFGDSSIPAQSNIVNARTNPQWSHIHANSIDGGSLIKGRLDWFSVPVTIEIGPQPGFFEGNEPVEKSVRVSDEGYRPSEGYGLDTIAYALFMAVLVIAVTICCVFCREERDGTDIFSIWSEHRKIKRQKISMDDFFASEALELSIIS